jgi:Rps23 Pro-64 3,4-dihydroxylase Tpa1-like proline 4-hydroxylase
MSTKPLTYAITPHTLNPLAESLKAEYLVAEPFPHTVIDNFLSPTVLEEVLAEFPEPQAMQWRRFSNKSEKKLASTSEQQLGPATRFLLYQLNSGTFIDFLEKLTGIEGLIPDPHFLGGGLHQIETGGYLKIHADFNKHERLNLLRRLNVLIYLNQNWPEEYGGHLQLWDKEMKECKRKVLPIFNRCVIFNTDTFSYHGHPDPLTCPEDRFRRSLALYYYTSQTFDTENFTNHSTLFQERPGELLKEDVSLKTQFKTVLKKCVPPIFIDLLK